MDHTDIPYCPHIRKWSNTIIIPMILEGCVSWIDNLHANYISWYSWFSNSSVYETQNAIDRNNAGPHTYSIPEFYRLMIYDPLCEQ